MQRIIVTALNIEDGEPETTHACPIALACRRDLHPAAEVDLGEIRVPGAGWAFDDDSRLGRWIQDYDFDGAAQPIDVILGDDGRAWADDPADDREVAA